VTPDFRKLWLGRSISFVGSEITSVALPLAAVLLLQADARQMGWLVAAQNLPWLLFGLAAGVWVDRVRRKPILVATHFGAAASLAAIPAAAYFDQLSMLVLAAAAFGASTMTVLSNVADRAYLPSLLAREQLVAANSRIQLSFSLSRTVGPGAAGLLVQSLTAPIAILVDVVSFVVAGTLIGTIRYRESQPPPRESRAVADILEGVKRVVHDPVLRPLVLCGAIHNVCSMAIMAVYVLYLTQSLGFTPALLGATLVTGGVGASLGSVVASRLVERIGVGPALIGSQALTGVARLLIPLASGPLAVVVLLLAFSEFLLGSMRAIYNITQISLRQSVTEAAYLGRVNATIVFLLWAPTPIGALAGGYLGDAIGLNATLWLFGGGVLASTAIAYFSALRTTHSAF
jgi:predicted MFS family arabinose efflux permease